MLRSSFHPNLPSSFHPKPSFGKEAKCPQADALGCRSLPPVGLHQLLQAISTEVAAETRSIADTNAAAKTAVASRAEE